MSELDLNEIRTTREVVRGQMVKGDRTMPSGLYLQHVDPLLDEVVAWRKKWADRLTTNYCAYCDESITFDDPDIAKRETLLHLETCPKHPLAELREWLAKAEAVLHSIEYVAADSATTETFHDWIKNYWREKKERSRLLKVQGDRIGELRVELRLLRRIEELEVVETIAKRVVKQGDLEDRFRAIDELKVLFPQLRRGEEEKTGGKEDDENGSAHTRVDCPDGLRGNSGGPDDGLVDDDGPDASNQ